MKMKSEFEDYLDLLYKNPKCELVYSNDYELLLSIVLSSQTTDKRVNMVTEILFSKYKNLTELSCADIKDLEKIIRPIGSFRKKALFVKNISLLLLNKYGGKVPRDRDILITLPGVGRKSANVFLSEFYGDPYIGVDTHVFRVSKRLRIASEDDSVLDVEKKLMKLFKKKDWAKRHLQMVLFGRYHCKALKPNCLNCKMIEYCIEKKKNI